MLNFFPLSYLFRYSSEPINGLSQALLRRISGNKRSLLCLRGIEGYFGDREGNSSVEMLFAYNTSKGLKLLQAFNVYVSSDEFRRLLAEQLPSLLYYNQLSA